MIMLGYDAKVPIAQHRRPIGEGQGQARSGSAARAIRLVGAFMCTWRNSIGLMVQVL